MKYYVSVVQILGEEKYSKTIWKYFMRINFTIIRTMCLGYYGLICTSLTFAKVTLYSPGWFLTGQCPSGAFHHTGEAQGQWPVRVGNHRAVRRAGVWGARVHRHRATTHQQAAVPVLLIIIVLGTDHVTHPRSLTGGFRLVSAPARLRRGAAEGKEACPVSAAPGAGCHRRWRGQ